MKKNLPLLLVMLFLQCFYCPLWAQSIDENYNPIISSYGGANIIRKLENGKILLHGSFSYINGEAQKSIILLNPDGSIDNTFVAPDFGGNISEILVLPDSQILIVGEFTTVNTQPHKYLVKLNLDGSIDETFENDGPDRPVYKAVLQPVSGKIILFGFFTTYKGVAQKSLIRVDQSGNLDETFNAQDLLNEWEGSYTSNAGLAVQADDKIYYSKGGGAKLVRLLPNGAVDDTFVVGTGLDREAFSIVPLQDGRVYLLGNFTKYKGSTVSNIIRLMGNGSVDGSFSFTESGMPVVYLLIKKGTLTADNKLVVVGNGYDPSKLDRGAFAFRLNTNGSYDSTLPALTCGNGGMTDVITYPTGDFMVAGYFYGIKNTHALLKCFSTGVKATGFVSHKYESPGSVTSSTIDAAGRLLIVGPFQYVNHTPITGVARLNPDGSLDNTFTSPLSENENNWMDVSGTILLSPDNKILLGGSTFHLKDGTKKRSVIRLNENGSPDNTFTVSSSTYWVENWPFRVNTLQHFKGKLLIGGYGPYTDINVYLLEQNGALASGFKQDHNFGVKITAAALVQNNQILLAGASNTSVGKMIRLNEDGTIDPSFVLEQQFRGFKVIKPQEDGKILVGGSSNFGSLIRINPNGSTDTGFKLEKSGSFTINDVILEEGKGLFVAADNIMSAHYPDGSLNSYFNVVAGTDSWGNSIRTIIKKEDRVYAGGYFKSIGGKPSSSFAKINIDPVPVNAPAVFTAQVVNSRSAKLDWENTDALTKMVIERAVKEEGPFTAIGKFDNSVNTFSDDHLVSSTTYYYRARLENFSGSGPTTELKVVETPANELKAPYGLLAEVSNYVDVKVSWRGAFADVKSFVVEMYTDTTANPVKQYTTTHSSIKLSLKENSRFYFRVRADYGTSGKSDPSGWLVVKTETVPFYQPYNFEADITDVRKAILQWEDSSLVTTSYKLFKSAKYGRYGFGEREIATFDGVLRIFEDREVEAGFTYTYRLQAISKSGSTVYSQSIEVVIPNYLYGTWGAKQSLATGRSGAIGFSVMGKGYIGLGFNGSRLSDLWEYNPGNNSWVSKAAYPGGARNEAMAFVIGGKAYVGMGRSGAGTEKDFYEFDPLNNSWNKLADYPNDGAGNSGLAGGVSFVIDGKGYVALGNRNGVVNTDLWAYDPELNTWTKKASYPGAATEGAVSWTENGIGYVAFGGVMTLSKELWKYNPKTDTWTNTNAYLSEAERTESVAGFLAGKAIVTGGNLSNNIFSKSLTDQTLYYSNIYNTWLYVWGYRFTGPVRHNAVSFTIGNRMYVATGSSATSTYLSDLWVLEPNTKTPPATPNNLTFKPATETSGWLNWNLPQDNEEGIKIEIANSEAGPFSQLAILAPGVKKHQLENLTNGNTYYVRVSAYNSDASSGYATLVLKMVLPPASPTTLAATLTTANQVSLSWQDAANNETGFQVWRKQETASDSAVLVHLPANSLEYTDEAVAENTGYTYYVVAINEGGVSGKSNAATLTTGYNQPLPPMRLEIGESTADLVTLFWNNAAFTTGTEIWVKSGTTGTYSLVATVIKGVGNYSYKNLSPEQTYYIKLRSKNHSLFSEYTEELIHTMPPKAPVLSDVVYAEKGKIKIKWDDFSTVEDGYIVFSQQGEGSWLALDTLAADAVGFTHIVSETEVTYNYKVAAFNSGGKSSDSNQKGVYIYTVVPNVPLITSIEKVAGGFLLNWEVNPEHNNGVVLEYKVLGSDFVVSDTFDIQTLSTTFELAAKTDWLYFRARSINVEGYSAYSPEASIEVTTLPLAPTNLTLSQMDLKRVKLVWQDKSNNEDGYIIEYYHNDGVFKTADTVAANSTSYMLKLDEEDGSLTARVTAFNVAGTASSSEEGISIILAADDLAKDEYKIFPNPTSSMVYIEGNCQKLKVYNNQGRLILEKAVGDSDQEIKFIDLRAFPSGIYHLELQSWQKVVKRSIIKL